MLEQPQWSVINWSDRTTWHPQLTKLLKSHLKPGAIGRMRKVDTSTYYADDSEWLALLATEIRYGVEAAHDTLMDVLNSTRVRAYHGCRTEDAGSYFREGLRIHSRTDLVEEFLRLVDANDELRPNKERFLQLIADITREIDQGKCFVTLDARGLVDHAGHYLIYGSELFTCFTREGYQHILTERGTPTLIELEIPLSWAADWEREALAEDMFREWTRLTVSKDQEVIDIDFTLVFDKPIPSEYVTGHSHPPLIPDPLRNMLPYRVKRARCLHCE